MNFASDNWAGASPRVRDALAAACEGLAPSYGHDEATNMLAARMAELFACEVAVFLVPTGTAANALALSAFCPPYGVVLAHEAAHIVGDECGAPEFFSHGGRLVTLPGLGGKLAPHALEGAFSRLAGSRSRFPSPAVLSLTQATECGTLYSLEEIKALTGWARERGLNVHMDGARFANAVAALGCAPAEITWKAGIDVLAFGATKNGAMMAEAVVFFDPARAEDFDWRRKRGGHVVSKARLISTQFLALLADGHWLELARHANAMAARLAAGLGKAGYRLAWPAQANEVFPILPVAVVERLRRAGAGLYEWPTGSIAATDLPGAEEALVRLVASFTTTPEEVDRFLALAA
jgi:threonine aldolase